MRKQRESHVKGSSRVWLWRHAVARSSLGSATKHVLITLSFWMNSDGGSCYPPPDLLVQYTGYRKKSVLKHLRIAEAAGWIEISNAGYKGRASKRRQYIAREPDEQDKQISATGNMADQGAVELGQMTAVDGVPDALKMGHEIPHVINSPREPSKNSPNTDGVSDEDIGAQMPRFDKEGLFDRFRRIHPTSAAEGVAKVRAAFEACAPDQQIAGVTRHRAWLDYLQSIGRNFCPSGASYWEDRLWEGLPQLSKSTDEHQSKLSVKAWSREWWAAILHAAAQGDHRRVSYICTMLRDHGYGMSLDPSCNRDQRILALSKQLDEVGKRDPRWIEIERWFTSRTGRSIPELPIDLDHVHVPNAEGFKCLNIKCTTTDAGV